MEDGFTTKEDLLRTLETETQVFKDILVKEAFSKIDRKDFIGSDYEIEAYEDYSVPIGFDHMSIKPTVIAFSLELLHIKKGEHVLNIFSSSGFVTALVADMVGKTGSVLSLETIPELAVKSKEYISKYKLPQAEIKFFDKSLGFNEEKVFDKIIIYANLKDKPNLFLERLKIGGIMVVAIQGVLYRITKKEKGVEEEKILEGFMFPDLDLN